MLGRPGVQFVRDSVENEATVNTLVAQCDGVFHLAAAVGVQLVLDEPVRTIRTTIHGTEVVLDAANRFGRPVLITSSSEVYGKGAKVPFHEDDDVVMGPTQDDPLLLRLLQGDRRVPRPGVPQAVRAAAADRAAVQHGRPAAGRALRHGAPAVRRGGAAGRAAGRARRRHADAVLLPRRRRRRRAGRRSRTRRTRSGQVYNLGGDQEVSINDLAARVIHLAGSRSRVEHVSLEQAYGHRFDDMPRRVPDLRKVREAIGFRPRLDLDEIIRSVIDHLRSEPAGSRQIDCVSLRLSDASARMSKAEFARVEPVSGGVVIR